jgi:uncharacterized membrane protein YcaP (DUF421 family)
MDQRLFSTLGAGFILVLLHRLFGMAAYYSHAFGILVKGKPAVLMQDGSLQRKNMLREYISEHDLEEDMRLDAKRKTYQKYKLLGSNAAETSALSKRMTSSNRRRN